MNKFKNIFKNKIFLTIFLSIIVFGIILFVSPYLVSFSKDINYRFLGFKNNIINFEVSKDIIIVKIDEKSLKRIDSFPFSREVYTKVFKILKEKGVAVVGLDVVLSDNGPDKNIDDLLAKQIKQSNNIVLGAPIFNDGVPTLDLPIDKFKNSSLGFGFFNPNINKDTLEVYSFSPQLKLRNKNKLIYEDFINFDIEILKKYFHINNSINSTNISFNLNENIKIPYSNAGSNKILINYLPQSKFKETISLSDIYKKEGIFEQIDFKNKIVLIGATAQGLKDIFITPNGIDFGIYIHANIINTILSGKYLVYFNLFLEQILILLLIIIAIYFNLSRNNKTILLSNIAILSIFIFLPLFLTLGSNLLLNNTGGIVFAFILSIVFSNIIKYLIENKDKKKILKALGEYISKDIAEEILNGGGNINLEGEKKIISIFFSDIEGFTTISEKLNPEELVIFLREYLGEMSDIIMDEKGLIDKYEGDAIMALWGVFGYENSSTFDNCISALKQQKRLKLLNIEWKKRFGEELKIRMGLNTGETIVGNIGSTGRKMEFTALGDAVNLASRLEEVNKKYGTYLCVSESVYEEQKNNFEFRYLDKIRVKGKDIPISIYELLSKKGELSELKKDIIAEFNIGIDLYLKQKFIKASQIFEKLSKLGDKPSITYAKRCLQFEIVPPGDNWDHVWTMKTK